MSHTRFRRLGLAAAETLFVPGQHKEQEAQAVEPATDLRVVEAASELKCQTAALRPTGDRSSQVERAGSRGGARQDETVRHRNRLLQLGSEFLEAVDAGRRG